MSDKTIKALMSLIICSMVILTDSLNSNMGFLRDGAAADAPTTAFRRALVGGYEVFATFNVLAHGLPLFATTPRDCKPRGETHAAPWPRCLFAEEEPAHIPPHGLPIFHSYLI
ncbi:hypothetical protein [Accumulibacter sp.]|uniref:hypothetical protein n=1 Tax=Accumulibacter sp. TaxID=2053492 RepID=UPI001AC5B47B|nr:hypothetical protein [Accumulibacter sp.]MBN8512667.1 hypothetical protein [Accumulibacter sp.]HRE72466.1 hypothetical protein [Accumulibacter sp.]